MPTRGQAKPPCRLFNIYTDMHKKINYDKTKKVKEQMHQRRTRKPLKARKWIKGERVPPTKAWYNLDSWGGMIMVRRVNINTQ